MKSVINISLIFIFAGFISLWINIGLNRITSPPPTSHHIECGARQVGTHHQHILILSVYMYM